MQWVCCWAPCGQEISIDSRRRRPAATAPQHGTQQQMWAVWRWQLRNEAEHRLVACTRCCASVGTGCGPVSVSVTCRCSIETAERIGLVLAWELRSTSPTLCCKEILVPSWVSYFPLKLCSKLWERKCADTIGTVLVPWAGISIAEIEIYFSNKIYRSNFVKQHSETVMVWNYQNADCSLKKNKFIVSFTVIFGTLSFPIARQRRRGRVVCSKWLTRGSTVLIRPGSLLCWQGVLRQVPLVGSLINWWSPPPKDPIKGRTFNLTSGKNFPTVVCLLYIHCIAV